MVTRCWSNFDHHLGFVHNSWRCCNLQWRADQGDGLARSYSCFVAVVHWHFLAPAFEPGPIWRATFASTRHPARACVDENGCPPSDVRAWVQTSPSFSKSERSPPLKLRRAGIESPVFFLDCQTLPDVATGWRTLPRLPGVYANVAGLRKFQRAGSAGRGHPVSGIRCNALPGLQRAARVATRCQGCHALPRLPRLPRAATVATRGHGCHARPRLPRAATVASRRQLAESCHTVPHGARCCRTVPRGG
jgi:hypothetical protein